MIRGVIFDFDGTLFDSMFVWDTAGEVFLRSVDRVPEADLKATLKTMSLYQSACYLREHYRLQLTPEEIMERVNDVVENFYFHTVQPKPGVIELLEQLQAHGIKMCIATATDRYQVEAALKRCGMAGFFSEIFTCTQVESGKDQPCIFRRAMEYLGTERADTMVVEDAWHAAQTAKTDGFFVAAIYDSHESKQAELREIADVYLDDYLHLDAFGCIWGVHVEKLKNEGRPS